MADALADQFWQLPGISRTAATFTFLISALSHTGLLDGSRFYYFGPLVWKFPPQLWRLVTSFCMTGPQLSIVFDTYFMYNYMSQLETGHPRMPRKADLLWYLIFVGGVIMAINGILEFSPFASFLPALLVAMAYTVTQQQQGMKINYFFINIPAPLVPYAMMGVSLLFPGGHLTAIFQAFGLIAAHLYEFLTKIWPQVGGGTNFIPTPPLLDNAVHFFQGTAARIMERAYGTAIYPAQAASGSSTGSSTGANTGPLPDSWKTRGTGRRLG